MDGGVAVLHEGPHIPSPGAPKVLRGPKGQRSQGDAAQSSCRHHRVMNAGGENRWANLFFIFFY